MYLVTIHNKVSLSLPVLYSQNGLGAREYGTPSESAQVGKKATSPFPLEIACAIMCSRGLPGFSFPAETAGHSSGGPASISSQFPLKIVAQRYYFPPTPNRGRILPMSNDDDDRDLLTGREYNLVPVTKRGSVRQEGRG
jgi:hypothetical protein